MASEVRPGCKSLEAALCLGRMLEGEVSVEAFVCTDGESVGCESEIEKVRGVEKGT